VSPSEIDGFVAGGARPAHREPMHSDLQPLHALELVAQADEAHHQGFWLNAIVSEEPSRGGRHLAATLRRARQDMGVRPRYTGTPGVPGQWLWGMPD